MVIIFDCQQWVGYADSYSLDLLRVYDFKLLVWMKIGDILRL